MQATAGFLGRPFPVHIVHFGSSSFCPLGPQLYLIESKPSDTSGLEEVVAKVAWTGKAEGFLANF